MSFQEDRPSRVIKWLLAASWVLALAALFVIPRFKPSDARELFPAPPPGPAPVVAPTQTNPNSSLFVIGEYLAIRFTVWEAAASAAIMLAALFWLAAAAIMIKSRHRMVEVLLDEVRERAGRARHFRTSSYK